MRSLKTAMRKQSGNCAHHNFFCSCDVCHGGEDSLLLVTEGQRTLRT